MVYKKAIIILVISIVLFGAAIFIGIELAIPNYEQKPRVADTRIAEPVMVSPIIEEPISAPLQEPIIEEAIDPSIEMIKVLSTKWNVATLGTWESRKVLGLGGSFIVPSSANNFILSEDKKDFIDSVSGLKNPIVAIIRTGISGKNNLWGSCVISQNNLIQGVTLEKWIQDTWKQINKDNCAVKNASVKNLKGETWGSTCMKGAKIDKKVNENIVEWNFADIGAPPIISSVVGNKIVHFECGNDISSASVTGNLDFMNFIFDVSQTFKLDEVVVSQLNVQAPSVDQTISWQVYTNSQFGINLKIPTDWTGYAAKVEAIKNPKISDGQCGSMINFSLPKYEGVFSIKVCSKDQWTQLQKNAEYMANAKNEVLGQNETNVFIFGQGALLAAGNLPVDDPMFASQLKEVEGIKKTFTLSK